MTNETIITSNRVLAWSGQTGTNITLNDDAQVFNSSGGTIWWWVGTGARNEIGNSGVKQFYQTTTTTIYNFANGSTAAAQITLTLTGKPKL
jgi:hypothetical protein